MSTSYNKQVNNNIMENNDEYNHTVEALIDEIINRDFNEGTMQETYENCNRQINLINEQLDYYNRRIRIKLFREFGPRWYRHVENTDKDNKLAFDLRCKDRLKIAYPDDIVPQDEIDKWKLTYEMYNWTFNMDDLVPAIYIDDCSEFDEMNNF